VEFLIGAEAGRVKELSRRLSFWLRLIKPHPRLTTEYAGPNRRLLRMRDAESEGDIPGRQTTKTWVNNIFKESNAHDGVRSRILSMRRQRMCVSIYPN
jgi:hypothetical protein